ncbi:MAG: hypothetical protein ABIG68_08040 [Acidobacteriota bacterium]
MLAWHSPAFSKGIPPRHSGSILGCGTSLERTQDALARAKDQASRLRSRETDGRRGPRLAEEAFLSADADIGDIAVIQDDGSLVVRQNLFDLSNRSILFEPRGSSAYRVVPSTAAFSPGGGTAVVLQDDDTRTVPLGFTFGFYGVSYDSVFLNSDGNLTFTQSDTSSSARDLGRFIGGPPRIGPLFADLDPTSGTVRFRSEADGIVFLWEGVPRYETQNSNNFSVKLFTDGRIEFNYGRIDSPEAVVGISPGSAVSTVSAVDFATGLPTEDLAGSIVEVFALLPGISETAIVKKFLQTHPDDFDQVIVFLAFPFSFQGAFAFELNVKNEDRGIGLELMDHSAEFGSGGKLKSFVMMGSLDGSGRFPDDPTVKFFRTNRTYNSLEILAHEVGHRWLAYSQVRLGGTNSNALLWPQDLAHWNFFFNADASVMEGNRIEDRGEGLGNQRFITVAATSRYSWLDRYLMGFEDERNIPDMFLVENPSTSRTLPEIGVVFGGTRRNISIGDVIAANGPRNPPVTQSRKVHRQAFILVTNRDQEATAEQIAKLQRLRDAWVPYFTEQSGSQSYVVTDLQQKPGNTPDTIFFPRFRGDSRKYTGMALANWGDTPADVVFTAFDDSGSRAAQPAGIVNPRVITIPPRAQIARLDSQILGLSVLDTRQGWMKVESGSSEVTGFSLEGDLDQTVLDGAVPSRRLSRDLYFTRVRQEVDPLRGTVARHSFDIINPNDTAAAISLRLIDPSGTVRATAERVLNPMGRVSEDLGNLFPQFAQQEFTGYIEVGGDRPLSGFQYTESDTGSLALSAQPGSPAVTLYSAQFASGRAGNTRYFTDLNLINTSPQSRTVQVRLVDNDGLLVGGIANPVSLSLGPGAQRIIGGAALFGLPDPLAAAAITEGSLVVAADGAGIIGDIVFGDPVAQQFLASLPLDGAPTAEMVLSQVAQGRAGGEKPYFTGIALYNPNLNAVSVALEVYSETGAVTGSASLVLPGGGRISKTLPELVAGLNDQIRGYIRIRSLGGPVVGFELFGSQFLDFLAAVPPQPIGP